MKIFFIPMATIAAATFLFSCSVPESISIKTAETSYEIPLGSTEMELAKKFSAETVQDALSSDDESEDSQKIYAYEFNPTKQDDAVLEYVMNYPLKNYSLSLPEGTNAAAIASTAPQNSEGKYEYSSTSFTETLDTGINFKEILESIAGSSDDEDATDYSYIFDRIRFQGIEAYAYIECSDLTSDNAYFTGKIVVGETDPADVSDSSTYVGVLADSSATTDGKFNLVTTNTDLKELADSDSVITDSSFIEDGAYSVMLDSDALTDYMNGTQNSDGSLTKHEKLIISCKLTPTLEFESQDELQTFLENTSSLTINLNIIIRFPLKIQITDDIEIDDILDLAGNALDEDLLNRDDGEEFEFKKYTDLIEKILCDYKFSNSTNLSMTAKIVSNTMQSGERFFDDKEISFDGEEHSFEFSTTEILNIFETAPFMPKFYVKIDKTDGTDFVSIKRNSVFGAYAVFKLTTKDDGEVEVWSK